MFAYTLHTTTYESKSEVRAHEFYAAMRIKTHLDNLFYLSSLLSSDLSACRQACHRRNWSLLYFSARFELSD